MRSLLHTAATHGGSLNHRKLCGWERKNSLSRFIFPSAHTKIAKIFQTIYSSSFRLIKFLSCSTFLVNLVNAVQMKFTKFHTNHQRGKVNFWNFCLAWTFYDLMKQRRELFKKGKWAHTRDSGDIYGKSAAHSVLSMSKFTHIPCSWYPFSRRHTLRPLKRARIGFRLSITYKGYENTCTHLANDR